MIKEIADFHTHTFLSDGILSPIELIRTGHLNGYQVIAVTDHASASTLERVIKEVKEDCRLAEEYWGIKALAGVELTHVPARAIGWLACRARACGAEIVVVHGETIVEPVEPGTNRAAVDCPEVDILAHPGLITVEEATAAKKNGVFLEITGRRGHSLTNGHLVTIARETGAELVINSDAHAPGDLYTPELMEKVGLGAGLTRDELTKVLTEAPRRLLQKLEGRKRNET
ncbi:MAG: histidinol phosphate phosphatase domain-containing protein [Firmicutes bacterium]|nr:histidinol phosphate phosphatase domain-containing protein [Bacillota bacterium]